MQRAACHIADVRPHDMVRTTTSLPALARSFEHGKTCSVTRPRRCRRSCLSNARHREEVRFPRWRIDSHHRQPHVLPGICGVPATHANVHRTPSCCQLCAKRSITSTSMAKPAMVISPEFVSGCRKAIYQQQQQRNSSQRIMHLRLKTKAQSVSGWQRLKTL